MKATLPSCCLLLSAVFCLHGETLIRWDKKVIESKFHAEGATYGDVNGDGKNDIVYGPFWFEGPDFEKRHAYYEPKEYSIVGYSDNFFAYVRDLNGDGFNDILIIGFPGKEARLYLNPGKDVANYPSWPVHVVAGVVDGESPEFTDLTGDGKPEIVGANGGQFGYYEPDWKDAAKPWTWHPVSTDVGAQKFTHGMGVGDVNGDGRLDLIEARRWWEQPASPGISNLPSPISKPTPWPSHIFQLGGGGAQMFAYDFNGDGRNDIVTSLQAHGFGVAWFESKADTLVRPATATADKSVRVTGDGVQWQKHLMVGQEPWENEYGIRFSQPHAVALIDVDGDGLKDVITGRRYWAHNGRDPNEHDTKVLYWFQTKRIKQDGGTRVEFVPRMIDGDTGVGTQLVAGDINGDGLPDVVVGNKYGCRVLLQRREEVGAERYAQFQPKKIYGPGHSQPGVYKPGQSAQEAVKNMTLPAGFKAEIIAAERDVVQPIAMCFDERGRLWVAEGNSYPQKRAGDKGPDRILIFEDTKGTGKFDKRTVFLDGLNLVSGIEVGFGGVWVGAAPHLLFIPKDAADKPGEPKVLLDGWGMQDTHETLNSFIWGPDGWLYGCHGVFTHSLVGKPGAPDAERTPINAGVWRYHPVRHEFEIFAHGTSNPWGLDYDEHGEFFVTACVIPHLYHVVPGARYQRQAGQHFNPHTYDDIKTIADHAHYAGNIRDNAHWGDRHTQVNVPVAEDTDSAGGGHAHCGLCIYQGDNFPPEYRGEFIFGNLHGHRLVVDHVASKGSGFTGQHRADFLRSNDHWFIPIQQKVGPDGALYVSDWSDQQVCHQGSAAVEKWDRSNGRIYRIVYDKVGTKGGKNEASKSAANAEVASTAVANSRSLAQPPKAPFDLGKLSDLELAKLAVECENVWFERMARRVLMERSAAGTLDRDAKAGEMSKFAEFLIGSEFGQLSLFQNLRALWVLASVGNHGGDWRDHISLPKIDEHIRVWALRGLYNEGVQEPGSLPFGLNHYEHIVRLVAENNTPLVRRELASLLQRLPLDKRTDIAKALLAHKEDAADHNIPLLIWYGIEPVVAADAKAGLALAKASRMDQITGFIYRRMSSDDAGRNALLGLAAAMPNVAEREKTLDMIVTSARSTGRHDLPKDWSVVSAKLRDGASPKGRQMVDEMSALFGDKATIQRMREVLGKGDGDLSACAHALAVLVQVRDLPFAAKACQEIIVAGKTASPKPGVASPLRRKAIQALAALPDPENAGVLTAEWSWFTPEEKTDAVSVLASTRDGARAMLNAVGEKKIETEILTPYLLRQLQALKDKNVDALITQVWGTVNQAKPDLAQQKAKWRKLLPPDKLKTADASKGHEIFKGSCGTCHKLFGEGANVGPDITGSNRANLDYLLDNVLDPSAVIGKGYELNVFTMKDARVIGGITKEENATGYKVAMPGGVELAFSKNEVGKRDILKISMMPEGQFDALGPEMAANLVAYLQSNSSPPVSSPPVLRRSGGSAPPEDTRTMLKVEGAIEGETMKVLAKTGGNPHNQKMGGFRLGQWSNNDQLFWTGAKPGDVLTLDLPVAEDGKYQIKAVLTKARDYAMVAISLDGDSVSGSPFDFYNRDVVTSGELDLGTRTLGKGEHKLEVKIAGANPAAVKSHLFGLDYVKLEKR